MLAKGEKQSCYDVNYNLVLFYLKSDGGQV